MSLRAQRGNPRFLSLRAQRGNLFKILMKTIFMRLPRHFVPRNYSKKRLPLCARNDTFIFNIINKSAT